MAAGKTPEEKTAPGKTSKGKASEGKTPPEKTAARVPLPLTHWIAGTVLALAGGLAARFVAPGLAESARGPVAAIGHAAAGLGLLVIALGIRKRVWTANAAATATTSIANTAAANITAATAADTAAATNTTAINVAAANAASANTAPAAAAKR